MTQIKHTQIFVASHRDKTSHTGRNTPKIVPSRCGWPPFHLLKWGCATSVVGLELAEFKVSMEVTVQSTLLASKEPAKSMADAQIQKPGDHPSFRKNALGVKRPCSKLWESSGVFSEFRKNSRNEKSHSRNGASRLEQCESHNSRSNSRSDSRSCCKGGPPRARKINKHQGNHIYHRNLSSVGPISFSKASSSMEPGGVWFLFPVFEKLGPLLALFSDFGDPRVVTAREPHEQKSPEKIK